MKGMMGFLHRIVAMAIMTRSLGVKSLKSLGIVDRGVMASFSGVGGTSNTPYHGNGRSRTHKAYVRKIRKHQRYRAFCASLRG